jgi:hypothetical protein
VRKSVEYHQAGVRSFWVLDLARRTLDMYEHGDGWRLLDHLDDRNPRGGAVVLGVLLQVDLTTLLGQPAP